MTMRDEYKAIIQCLGNGERKSAVAIASWCGISTLRVGVLCNDLISAGIVAVGTHRVFNRVAVDYRLVKKIF